nr:WYL domain-containing protein [Streptomyces africanus]
MESVDHAHAEFLRLGTGIEVLAPDELRSRIARTVAELAERYGNSRASGGD